MTKSMETALARYGRMIQRDGWRAGEPLVEQDEKRFKDFRKWAMAIAIMLRAQEILENGHVTK